MTRDNPNDSEGKLSIPEQNHPGPVTANDAASAAFPIVGVGASAGGLEAYEQLLTHLPSDTGLGFVLIQHLDPHHESRLVDLLARHAAMPVLQVEDGVTVRANHVYVIPPNVDLSIKQGKLHITPRPEGRRPHLPIDHFFRSLAEDQKNCAVGVVLSGTGSDGATGLCEIKAAGGFTFAQDQQSAKYSGMPHSAAESGCADLILPPEQIARRLAELRGHPYLAAADRPAGVVNDESYYRRILTRLRVITGIDFHLYRDSTIKRRIMRRMALHTEDSLEQYVDKLEGDDAEVLALHHDLLINVTSFFRDADFFEALKEHVFPAIVENKQLSAPVRVWTAGCSTGQEAYSLAISLVEFFDDQPSRPALQIFATDVSDTPILERARSGVYPENIEAEVSPERLRRFFQKEDHSYRIDKTIRDMCVFARHNLLVDPPFSHVDLISCRNVLIYLAAPLQKRLIPTFHYALNVPGFLVLGSAETVGDHVDLFEAADRTHRIYAKKPVSGRHYSHFTADNSRSVGDLTLRRPTAPNSAPADFQREADRVLSGRFAPPGVLLDENLDIIQFRGHTGHYLEQPPGEPTNNVLKMARDGLFLELRTAVEEVRREHKAARRDGVRVRGDDGVRNISLEVMPIKAAGLTGNSVLVLFHEAPENGEASGNATVASISADGDETAGARLQQELTATKEYLQSLLEKQDVINEELRSANEEIMSSNEELQSTNEELETAKEELQSTNEELTTVNEQLHSRNLELNQLNNDLSNLLASIALPVLMVGPDLRIRRFTQSAGRAMNLLANDIGRPLGDLKTNFDVPDLDSLIHEVVDQVQVREREIVDRDGRWQTLRIHPYRTADRKIDGAVLILIDITDIKVAQQRLRENEERLRLAMDSGSLGTWYIDLESDRVYWDEYMQKMLGLPDQAARQGEGFFNALHPQDRATLRSALPLEHGDFNAELRFVRPDGSLNWTLTHAKAQSAESGARRVAGVCVAINIQKQLENILKQRVVEFQEADRQKNEFLALLAHELRNPLAPISNAAELLKRAAPATPDLQRSREIIEHGVTQMARILEDLLDVNRVSRHRLELRLEPVTLAAIVASAVEISQPQIAAKQHRLDVVLPPDEIWLSADPARLRQVFSNLLINAAKYTEPGGELRVEAERQENLVAVHVKDNGIGMSETLLSRAFDMFSQGERAEGGGLGIGLTLAKNLVELHGGSVEARSDGPGRGSDFIVRLPLMIDPRQQPDHAAPPAPAGPPPAQVRKRILVVDDNKVQATSLSMLMEFSGHEVKTAFDAASALAALDDFIPDFALIDLGLPNGKSGYDLARQIRSQGRFDKTVLIAQTGWGRNEDRERSRAAGFDHHVVKPIDHDQLQRIIDRAEPA